MLFTSEGFLEINTENWPGLDLNQQRDELGKLGFEFRSGNLTD